MIKSRDQISSRQRKFSVDSVALLKLFLFYNKTTLGIPINILKLIYQYLIYSADIIGMCCVCSNVFPRKQRRLIECSFSKLKSDLCFKFICVECHHRHSIFYPIMNKNICANCNQYFLQKIFY